MAKMKFNTNGGQGIVNTVHGNSTSTIRRTLLEQTEKKESLATILGAMNHKDRKHAEELLFGDDELSKLIGQVVDDTQELEVQRPIMINKTRLKKQQEQKEKEEQERELKDKISLLQQKRAA